MIKTHTATIIFYSWSKTKEDTKQIERIRRFARRENLRVIGDRLEHTVGIPFYLPNEDSELGYDTTVIPHVEHRYFLKVAAARPAKLHELVSLLQAYASYCGMNTRLFGWEQEE